MPRIAEFYGIAIHMYFRDHAPGHFQAICGRFDADVGIAAGDLLKGKLPMRARRLGRERSQDSLGTGRPIVWRDRVTCRFSDGRIAEDWVSTDLAERLLLGRKR